MKTNILGALIIVVIGIAALVLVTPVVLGGAWSVKITKITFTTNIDTSLRPQASFSSSASSATTTVTSYEYYYAIRSGGTVAPTENNVNRTAGNFTGFVSWFLVNPSNQTVSQGNYTFSGGFGNRTHTFTFSADQGIRAAGTYRLVMLLSGNAKAFGASPTTVANDMRYASNVP